MELKVQTALEFLGGDSHLANDKDDKGCLGILGQCCWTWGR